MLMSEKEFQKLHGREFARIMEEARLFVDNPDLLRQDIHEKEQTKPTGRLINPSPHQFTYRMMSYRGYLRYPERLKNLLVSRNQERKETSLALPTLLDIEPVSRCNFRCVMCVTSRRGPKRAEDLDTDAYKRFIEDNLYLTEVKLQGVGEPLLHNNFFDLIRFTMEHDIWVRTTVNGSLLHIDENYKRLIDCGIGEVQISFDGATKEVFESIRRGADFDKIVDNVTKLNAYANTKDRPYTRMWVLLQKDNRHQVFDLVALAKRMGFNRVTFSVSLIDWGREGDFVDLQANSFSEEEEQRLLELGQAEDMDITVWHCAKRFSSKSLDTICPVPFNRLFIGSDLKVIPCGGIGDPGIVCFGDAMDIKNIWNSEQYRKFRKAHLQGKIPSYCKVCYKD